MAVASLDCWARLVTAGGAGSCSAVAGRHDTMVCTGIRMAGMRLWLVCWGVASDVYDESWMVWLCFAAVAGIGNNGGHAVCDEFCCRLGG